MCYQMPLVCLTVVLQPIKQYANSQNCFSLLQFPYSFLLNYSLFTGIPGLKFTFAFRSPEFELHFAKI